MISNQNKIDRQISKEIYSFKETTICLDGFSDYDLEQNIYLMGQFGDCDLKQIKMDGFELNELYDLGMLEMLAAIKWNSPTVRLVFTLNSQKHKRRNNQYQKIELKEFMRTYKLGFDEVVLEDEYCQDSGDMDQMIEKSVEPCYQGVLFDKIDTISIKIYKEVIDQIEQLSYRQCNRRSKYRIKCMKINLCSALLINDLMRSIQTINQFYYELERIMIEFGSSSIDKGKMYL